MIYLIDLFGVAVFAISGALVAGKKEMDLFGVVVLAIVTAIGGGTLRDLLLGSTPVFWIHDPLYIFVAMGAALATVWSSRYIHPGGTSLLVADAVGLSFFCVLGAAKGLLAGTGPTIATLLGVMTGVVGGVIRDLLAGDMPMVLRRDLYATAAVLGAGLFSGLHYLGASNPVAVWSGLIAALALRLAAMRWHFTLPIFSVKGE